jgi:hypothetical protein
MNDEALNDVDVQYVLNEIKDMIDTKRIFGDGANEETQQAKRGLDKIKVALGAVAEMNVSTDVLAMATQALDAAKRRMSGKLPDMTDEGYVRLILQALDLLESHKPQTAEWPATDKRGFPLHPPREVTKEHFDKDLTDAINETKQPYKYWTISEKVSHMLGVKYPNGLIIVEKK